MKHAETVKALSLLAAVWPTREVTPAMVEAYHMAWEDVPYDALQPAIKSWIGTAKFFPTPGELRELALRDALALPAAEVAWAEVVRRIADTGHASQPRWSTAVLEHTVNALGWRSICQWQEDQLGTLRAQFRNTYDAYAKRVVSGDATAALAEHARRQGALTDAPPSLRLIEGQQDTIETPSTEPAYSTLAAQRRWQDANPGKPLPTVAGHRDAVIDNLMALPTWRDLPEDYRQKLLARHGLTPADVASREQQVQETMPASNAEPVAVGANA